MPYEFNGSPGESLDLPLQPFSELTPASGSGGKGESKGVKRLFGVFDTVQCESELDQLKMYKCCNFGPQSHRGNRTIRCENTVSKKQAEKL